MAVKQFAMRSSKL